MDLIADFRKSVEVLRSNLLLFLPALIIFYLIPVALLIVAAYVFVPIIVVALKGVSPLSTLPQGLLLGATIIIVLAVLAYVYVLSGAANLNRKAVQTGRTSMDDFWEGCRKYFGKVLGGVILLGIIYGIIIAIGIILTLSIILPNMANMTVPESIGEFPIRTFEPERFARLTSWLLEVFKMISDPLWIWLVLSTAAGLIFIFTLFWVQALVVDEVGILRAIDRSIKFVKNNFKTTLGIIGLWIIAQGFTRAIFPGGGMGGGGPGYGYGFGFPPPLQAIFQLLIATFFTLLLYTVYMDKTGKAA